MLSNWDHREVQWFDTLESIYDQEVAGANIDEDILLFGEKLKTQLDLPVLHMDEDTSSFFKQHYLSYWKNQGPTVREN